MIAWIVKNKEWLFSGVGVTLFLAICGFLYRHFQIAKEQKAKIKYPIQDAMRASQKETPIQVIPQDGVLLQPIDILSAIKNAPLLQQPDIIPHYIGLKVSWKGRLKSASKTRDGNVRILLFDEDYVGIQFEVKPSDYPGLGLLKEDSIICVNGAIKDIQALFIDLVEAKMNTNV